jgi:hypothetical protein
MESYFYGLFISDVKIFFSYLNIYSMSTRQDLLPIPNLADYAFGERLGAGSYGKEFSLQFIFIFLVLGTVYKARLISVCKLNL